MQIEYPGGGFIRPLSPSLKSWTSMKFGKYVQEGKEGIYHCFTRCMRRAFLYGFDAYTGRNNSYLKTLLVNRLSQLTKAFPIEVCACALGNHHHTILCIRPKITASWPDHEVATRWLTLFPRYYGIKGFPAEE